MPASSRLSRISRFLFSAPRSTLHAPRLLLALFALLCGYSSSASPPDKSGVKPSVLSLPSGPGSIEGLGKAFQPQINTGTATYGVPIKIPPGTAGFAPSVELSYNSGSGNSAFGQGWNCTPALSIERQTEKGFPRYRDTDSASRPRDVFLFHGEELVPLTDGTFRCQNETEFRRFRPISSQGAGVDAWLVEDRDGTKHWLGRYKDNAPNGGDSRVVNPAPPQDGLGSRSPLEPTYLWCEDAAQDVNGNRIEFDYMTDYASPGLLYLDQIRYFANGNTANYHLVKFYYETRADQLTDNRSGFPRTTAWRCREIGVSSFYAGQLHPIRAYVLSYNPADGALGDIDAGSPFLQKRVNLGLSYLHSVTEYDSTRGPGGVGGTGNLFPPMRFAYSGFYLQTPPTNVLQALAPLACRLRPGEASPLVLGPVQGALFQSANPDDTNSASTLIFDALLQNSQVQFADMNGDGLPDLLNTETDQTHPLYRVAWNYGNGLFKTSASVNTSPVLLTLADHSTENAVTLTDLNADGVCDLVQIAMDGSSLKTRLYPNRYDPGHADGPTGFTNYPTTDATTPLDVSLSAPNVRQMDIDFDKRPDVLVCNSQGIVGYRSELGGGWTDIGRQDWSQANGDGRIPSSYSFSRVDPPHAERSNPLVFLADMNGDRLLDLVQIVISLDGQATVLYRPLIGSMQWGEEVVFQFATLDGTPSGAPAILPLPGLLSDPIDPQNHWDSIQLLDVNGDGLTDIVYVQQNQSIRVFLNCAGKAFMGPFQMVGTPIYQPYDASNPTLLRAVDIDGNGSTDLVFYHASGGTDRVGFRYVEFAGGQKPGLLQVIDNGIGRRTFIRYRSATDDLVRARKAGHPWLTTMPNPVWVVAGMVDDIGLDLNGDGATDLYATSFDYRDGYYDGFQKQFRGFAYAQKTGWGDDVDSGTALPTGNGLGQVGAPTSVIRYRFMTGSPDGADNDQYISGYDTEPRTNSVDETTPLGGREEESLKGKPVWEEAVDGSALLDPTVDFDTCADATGRAARSGDPYGTAASRCTPDKYTYSRTHSQWAIRRLYRPAGMVAPKGRLLPDEPATVCDVAKSVTFPVLLGTATEDIEANILLQQTFSHPNAPVAAHGPVITQKDLDYDNFGNTTLEFDYGVVSGLSPAPDDERVIRRSFILTRGGSGSIDNWILNRPLTERVEDENGLFASETHHYYDGSDFIGLPLGQIGNRGLETRVEQRVKDPAFVAPAIDQVPTSQAVLDSLKVPSDPRGLSPEWISVSRRAFDQHGNVVWTLDPLGQVSGGAADASVGHAHQLVYDSVFHTFPIEEHIKVGGGQPELVMRAEYQRAATATSPEVPWGFGVMTRSFDFNGNTNDYFYDSFARLTAIVKPGDSETLPTALYTYRPADPHRGLIYNYDRAGALALGSGPVHGVADSVQTDARQVSGQSAVFTTLNYTDGNGNKLLSLEQDETAGLFAVKEATRYTLRGTPLYHFQPYRQTGSGFALPDLTLPRTDLFADAQGRVIRTLLPPETTANSADRRETRTHYLPLIEYTFDEEDIASSDPAQPHLNTPMVHYKDGLGRLTGVDETVRNAGDGSGPGSLQTWQTRYDYDLHDNLVHLRDSQNNEKWFRYDGLSRKLFMNDPDRGTMLYTYDDASNLRETVDAKAQHIQYTYDGVNRLLTENYLNGLPSPPWRPLSTNSVVYHYDSPVPNLPLGDNTTATAQNTKGFLAYVEDLSGEEHTSYDSRARVQWVAKRLPDPLITDNRSLITYTTRFIYDSLDRVTRLTYPDNDQVDYQYNGRNLLQRIIGGPSGNIISNITYQPSAQLAQIDYGNAVRTTYAYDPRLRLNSLNTVGTSSTSSLISFGYQFDGVSNIKQITDTRPTSAIPASDPRRNTQLFQYDDLFRLTQAKYNPASGGTNSGTINYAYDRIGNMMSQTSDIVHNEKGLPVANLGAMSSGGSSGRSGRVGRQPTAPPGPHALTSISHSPFATRNYPYDANGNMLNIDGLTNTWDFKDRLVAVQDTNMAAFYTYDYTDRRVIKRVTPKVGSAGPSGSLSTLNSQPSTTLYIDKFFEVREHDAPTKYVWNGNTRVARVTGSLSTNQRLQRLRIYSGWNLCSLAVTAPFSAFSLQPSAFRWNPSTQTWLSVAPTDTLPAGTVLWLYATTNATLTVTGTYTDPTARSLASGPNFLPSAGLESWDLASTLNSQPSTTCWLFDCSSQSWDTSLPPPLSTLNPQPSTPLAPGAALCLRATQIAQLEIPDSALRLRYYHQDHLGSSSVLTDTTGQLVEESANYAFGSPRHQFQPRGIQESYQFTQKEADDESGLQYFERRFLASRIGRFVSVDSHQIDRNDATNRSSSQILDTYLYAANNPMYYVDPDGKFILTVELNSKALYGSYTLVWNGLLPDGIYKTKTRADSPGANAAIKSGVYDYTVIDKDATATYAKHKALLFSKGGSGDLPTIDPNPEHGGASEANGIMMHVGNRTTTTTGRTGSHGCWTVPIALDNSADAAEPSTWKYYNSFIGSFDYGDQGKAILIRPQEIYDTLQNKAKGLVNSVFSGTQ